METTTKQTVNSAEVIYDAGWYVRLHLNDGQESDVAFHARRDIGMARARKEARSAARSWGFAMPNGTEVVLHV